MDNYNAPEGGAQGRAAPERDKFTLNRQKSGSDVVVSPVSGGSGLGGYPDIVTPAVLSGSLDPKHRLQLEVESAISADAIAARGYFTQTDRQALQLLGFSAAQALPPALVIPLFDWRGRPSGQALRPDISRTDSKGKQVKYELPKGSTPVLDVAPLTQDQIGDPSKPLVITEGAKKADAAASLGLCAINLNGVYGFRGKNLQGGLTALPDWENIALKDRVVYVVFDSDVSTKPHIESALNRLQLFLQSRGSIVKVTYLPDGPEDGRTGKPTKTGLDDFFARGGTTEQLFSLSRDLEPVKEAKRKARELKNQAILESLAATGLPCIETSDQQLESQIQSLATVLGDANQRAAHLFHSSQGLARVSIDKKGHAVIVSASVEIVQDAAAKAANWVHTSDRQGILNTFPPRNLCSIFTQTPHNWRNIPPIDNVVTAPFFAPDGMLCATRGYHRSANVWLDLPSDFELPDTTPTLKNIKVAKQIIFDTLLGEVAFSDKASKAHAFALMLLPFVRRLIPDCTPLHLFDAPVQSSGKSYAAEICIEVFDRAEPANEIADEAEWAKWIFTAMLEGRTHLFFDNIKGRLSSSALASYITSKTKSDRILGLNRRATVSTLGTVWVASSNNARLDRDAQSRSLLIRLDTGMEQPEDREYRGDPKVFIEENREQVLAAIITLVRHWQNQGCPLYLGGRSRFKDWARIIGGILEAVEVEGFLQNVDQARENLSPENDAWRVFVSEWFEAFPRKAVIAKDLLPIAFKIQGMADQIGEKEGQAKRLGDFLTRRRDQVFGDYKITRDSQKSNLGMKWRLLPVDSPMAVGFEESSLFSDLEEDESSGRFADSELYKRSLA